MTPPPQLPTTVYPSRSGAVSQTAAAQPGASILSRAALACILLVGGLSLMACSPQGGAAGGGEGVQAASAAGAAAGTSAQAPSAEWAIAIHGGAGVIPQDLPEEVVERYRSALESALRLGQQRLEAGDAALDVVEAVVKVLEDAPEFNAGKGAVFTHDGRHELDAAIMDGRDLSCGAVARLTTVRNPIEVARGVMERSRHVFMAGDGAEAFADELAVTRVEPEYFYTERRWQQLQEALAAEGAASKHGTVGAVARDREGNLAAATSTGGMTNKRFGRIGDVPVIGAGTYADNRTAAISCTGKGEEFIRHSVAHRVSMHMALGGMGLEEAAREVIHGVLEPGDGGLIAVDSDGRLALVFNSPGMFRGAADSGGRFDVAIWQD
ncbi:MAG: isoaspartyl peptidase/L-asparaginase [Acidobacteriota bacterium]